MPCTAGVTPTSKSGWPAVSIIGVDLVIPPPVPRISIAVRSRLGAAAVPRIFITAVRPGRTTGSSNLTLTPAGTRT